MQMVLFVGRGYLLFDGRKMTVSSKEAATVFESSRALTVVLVNNRRLLTMYARDVFIEDP